MMMFGHFKHKTNELLLFYLNNTVDDLHLPTCVEDRWDLDLTSKATIAG